MSIVRRAVGLVVAVVVPVTWQQPASGQQQSQAGTLDPTFGTSGLVTTEFTGGYDSANAVVVQADGKVVAAGVRGLWIGSAMSTDFGLVRYDHTGHLDPSFGAGGRVITDLLGSADEVRALVVQPDGKLVAAGSAAGEAETNFALARYNPDGTLDPTFGTDGKVTTDLAGRDGIATALVVQPDGKLVAAGYAVDVAGDSSGFALARYNPDGTLDPTFGASGRVLTDLPGGQANALVVQPDGKLVAAGFADSSGDADFALVRYRRNGALDARFGRGGRVTTDFASYRDQVNALVLLADGALVAAGSAGRTLPDTDDDDFALARYRPDDSLDLRFGTGGKVTTDFAGSRFDEANALAVQRDGRLVAAGISLEGSSYDFALTRYRRDGSLDSRFGSNGTVTTDFGGLYHEAHALAVQPDGNLVAAGRNIVGPSSGDSDFALARYRARTSPHR